MQINVWINRQLKTGLTKWVYWNIVDAILLMLLQRVIELATSTCCSSLKQTHLHQHFKLRNIVIKCINFVNTLGKFWQWCRTIWDHPLIVMWHWLNDLYSVLLLAIHSFNMPFHSCVLSCHIFELEWGWRWPCCDRDQYLVTMITT